MRSRMMQTLLPVFLLSGCGTTAEMTEVRAALVQNTPSEQKLDISFEEDELDESFDSENAVHITLDGISASADGAGVTVNKNTITITNSGTYVLSGVLKEGSIQIDSVDREAVRLVLNGVSITSTEGPAVYVKQADKLILTAVTGTENELAASGENTDEVKGTVWTAADLIINGGGSLTLNAETGDGIHGKGSLKAVNTILNITAASDGIDIKEDVSEKDCILTINAEKDGIKASGETDADTGEAAPADILICGGVITITAADDCMKASGDVQSEKAELNLSAGGGSENGTSHAGGELFGGREGTGMPGMGFAPSEGFGSRPEMTDGNTNFEQKEAPAQGTESIEDRTDMFPEGPHGQMEMQETETEEDSAGKAKAVSADGDIVIYSGVITVDAADDAFHAAGNITVEDGMLAVSSGDDAMHADDTLSVLGGTITIETAYEGLEATTIVIANGVINMTVSDDGINTADKLSGMTYGMYEDDGSKFTMTGGSVTIDARADGIDLNGSGEMSGGTVVIYGPEDNGNGALDYNGTFTVSGGTLLAGGSSGMMMTPDGTEDAYVLAVGIDDPSGLIEIRSEDGTVLAEYQSEKQYSSLVIAGDILKAGSTVQIMQSGKELGTAELSDIVTTLNITMNASGQQGGPMQGMEPGSGMHQGEQFQGMKPGSIGQQQAPAQNEENSIRPDGEAQQTADPGETEATEATTQF